MRTVWKFPFEPRDEVEIEMPVGAEVIHVGTQRTDDSPTGLIACMWATVNPKAKKVIHKFVVAGTGDELPAQGWIAYRGTFKILNDTQVFHVFERGPRD